MATTPNFASTNIQTKTFSNLGLYYTNYTGQWEDQPTAALPNLVTAGDNGTRITEINVKVTSSAGNEVYKIYLFDGSTYYLFDEQYLTGSFGPTVPVGKLNVTYNYLYLPSGWSLRMSLNQDTNAAGRVVVTSLDL